MNCDDAFDALTDSSRLHAAQLDAHLANCPRCRELQKVLEPALSLLCGDLPEERVPSAASRTPSLSFETIRLAESAAARLESMNAGSSRRGLESSVGNRGMLSLRRRRIRRAIGAALRSAALILFGALAVYFIGPWDRDSDPRPTPSAQPPMVPGQACTRNNFPPTRKGTNNAGRVVLSCVACHANDRQPRSGVIPSSLLWPSSGSRSWPAASSAFVLCGENRGSLDGRDPFDEIKLLIS